MYSNYFFKCENGSELYLEKIEPDKYNIFNWHNAFYNLCNHKLNLGGFESS